MEEASRQNIHACLMYLAFLTDKAEMERVR